LPQEKELEATSVLEAIRKLALDNNSQPEEHTAFLKLWIGIARGWVKDGI
jgi:hypothetical protein